MVIVMMETLMQQGLDTQIVPPLLGEFLSREVQVGLIMVIVNGQVDDVAPLDDDHQPGDNVEDNHNDATRP